jgi:hypothetical protein
MLEDEHGGTVHALCFANAVGHFHEASGAASAPASARARRINLLTCALMRRRRPEGSDWLGCNQWAPLSWSARSIRFGSFMARSVLFRPSFRSVIAREQLDKLDHAPPHAGVLDRSERTGEGEPVWAREEVRVLRISALSSSSERPSIVATMRREACQAPRRALGDGLTICSETSFGTAARGPGRWPSTMSLSSAIRSATLRMTTDDRSAPPAHFTFAQWQPWLQNPILSIHFFSCGTGKPSPYPAATVFSSWPRIAQRMSSGQPAARS